MTKPRPNTAPELLTPAEVAHIMRVDPKTVTRWARAGKLRFVTTMGGHRRYFAEDFAIVQKVHDTEEEPKW